MVEIIVSPSGDWGVIMKDGAIITEGHSINFQDLAFILPRFGVPAKVNVITDEQMENGDYF